MPNKRKLSGIDQKGRRKSDGQYWKLSYFMTQSEAFRSLSGGALKVLVEIRCRYNGNNNGHIFLSYQEAATLLGMSKSTVKRAFDELVEKGFLRKRKEGQWYGRQAAEYIITDKPFSGQNATNDWQQWRSQKRTKNRSSVPRRYANRDCVPEEYREPKSRCRESTRQPELRVVNGTA